MQNASFVAIFLTGLLTGGLTCLAVQGGLLAATIAQREEERLKQQAGRSGAALPIVWFLAAKLAAYILLGVLLGWFGSLFDLSLGVKLAMQFAVVIFMIGTAGALLDLHPFFRYFVIQPPKFLMRMVRNKSKSRDAFAPAILGAFTVFIPCGTTQAMMALAIASGSPFRGAGIMFSFVLGTTPLFFLLGYFAARLGDARSRKFLRVAALAVAVLALFNLNNALALTGKPITFGQLAKSAACMVAYCGPDEGTAAPAAGVRAEITIGTYGYSPNSISLKKDSDVTIKLFNKDGTSCAQAFTIPSLRIQKLVPVGQTEEITFHTPSEPTRIAFMCSMGMYRGIINVN